MKLTYEIAFVLGTVILLIISIAWVEFLAMLRNIIFKKMSPFWSQLIFTLLITLGGVLLLWLIQPYIDEVRGAEGAVRRERDILDYDLELPVKAV